MDVRRHQAMAPAVKQPRHRIVAGATAVALFATALAVTPFARQTGSAQPPAATAQTAKPGELGYDDTPTIPGQKWKVHDINRPAPPLVTPGATASAPPSDAIVLFDGKDLSKWAQRGPNGENIQPKWPVKDGYFETGMGDTVGGGGHEPGPWQQRRHPDGALRGAGARHVQQPHLRRRRRRVVVRTVAAARQRAASAR
jgi:hypothetical protein